MTPSDSELIARTLAEDDRSAFGELVQRHQSAVRRFLQGLTGNASLADELAQDAFVEAWKQLARFRGQSAFLTWTLGIAHNRWRNAWRRRQTERAFAAREERTEPAPSAVLASDLRQDVDAALKALDPEEFAVVHLSYRQGLSHSEIAEVLACPLGTVKTLLARARDKLKPLLAAWNPQT